MCTMESKIIIDRKLCIYPSRPLGCGELCVFNKIPSGSAECCCCSSWPVLWKSNVTQMGTVCFAFYESTAGRWREVLFSAKATGGRKDFNNVIWHVGQWLAVHIVMGVHWSMTFEEKSCWAFFKVWKLLSVTFYRASSTMSKQINSLASAPSAAEVITPSF